MATATGRMRRGTKGYQGVSMQDNWRTDWYAKQETAQRHLDEHLEELNGKSSKAKKAAKPADTEPETSDGVLAPGGQDTGPRGGEHSEPVAPGGQDTGPRGDSG